jgi:hypothetical protein
VRHFNRIKKLFKLFVSFLKDADLIGCKSSLLTAQKQSKESELQSKEN